MTKNSLATMTETALFAGLAMIIDLLTQPLMVGPWMSFSFKMVPIFILAFRRGIRPAMAAGLLWGLLQLLLGQAAAGWLTFVQGILDYLLAFSMIGLAGITKASLQTALKQEHTIKSLALILFGILIGTLSRYSIHFITGMIFFGKYAAPGQSAFIYSLIVNGTGFLGEGLSCCLILALLLPFLKRFLTV